MMEKKAAAKKAPAQKAAKPAKQQPLRKRPQAKSEKAPEEPKTTKVEDSSSPPMEGVEYEQGFMGTSADDEDYSIAAQVAKLND